MKSLLLTVLLILTMAAYAEASPIQDLPKSEVVSIDREYLKLSVKDLTSGEVLVLQITSESRFLLDGKYAISEDLNVGDTVVGKVHKRADGIFEVVKLTITRPKAAVVG